MISKIKYNLPLIIIGFFLFQSCKVDDSNNIIYYWSKEEGYPVKNKEISSDTLKSVNQNVEYYTNNAISGNDLDKVLRKDQITLKNKSFEVKKAIINGQAFYRIEITQVLKNGKKNYLGTYVFASNYGIILKGHPTLSIVDSIVKYEDSKSREVINLTQILIKVVNDTVLFPKPPPAPSFDELNKKIDNGNDSIL